MFWKTMKLEKHLLYIDITQFCGVGCDFCMYADKHNKTHLTLSSHSKNNLSNLINNPNVKKVSVSGEGEPLNNLATFYEILQLSKGNVAFEFITSGYIYHDKLLDFYSKIDKLISNKGDSCNIRLSSDSHHIPKLKNKPHGISVSQFQNKRYENLTLSFRSIDPDKRFSRDYLMEQIGLYGFNSHIEEISILEDKVIIGESQYNLDYKNLVWPRGIEGEYLDMWQYISALEKKYNKNFTLGSLNKGDDVNGLDITVKPNGNVHFYGIESICLGNIHLDAFSIEQLIEKVTEIPLIKALYSVPFAEIIKELAKHIDIDSLINKVNNPYWLIKEVHKHDSELLANIF
jgi:hypothetical protein